MRVLAAGWEMPCSAAARPRLPTRATLSSRSNPVRSDTRGGRGIARGYDLPADWPLPRFGARTDPGIVTQIIDISPSPTRTGPSPYHLPFGLLKELDQPQHVFRDLGPNWYASIMGTGIVAVAGASLPLYVPGLRVFATAVWALAAAALIALTPPGPCTGCGIPTGPGATPATRSWPSSGGAADGAATVGAGTLILGPRWLGPVAAVDADWALWLAGTALGLVTTCWIPYLMITRHKIGADGAFGGWLMPVVPPMVSAATGAC